MNVDEYRNNQSELSGIPLFNRNYSFYYDETGNVRKFRLTDKGVNASEGINNDFILGGVLFKGETPPCDLDLLYDNLGIDISEIKFKTLAGRGSDFWKTISKKPIHQFLTWLESSELYIHYATLNNMYFSIVDIVDSLLVTQKHFNFAPQLVANLKSSWHRFFVANMHELLPMFYGYNYPNLDKTDIEDFCYELSEFIQSYDEDDFYLEFFRKLLRTNGNKCELIFIQGNITHLLVEEYSMIRFSRCALYKYSMHYFDEEPEAESELKGIFLSMNDENLNNYKFINSKSDKLIQISDVLVGLLGKLFFMLDEFTPKMIQNKMGQLNKRQKECIRIISCLINKSENLHKALIMNVNSIDMIDHRHSLLMIMNRLNY